MTGVEPGFDIIDMGFDDYVQKPVTRGDLVALVERMLRSLEYDDAVRLYFSMATKVALIESGGADVSGLDAADARVLRDRLATVEAEAERVLDAALDAGGMEAILQRSVPSDRATRRRPSGAPARR